MAVERGGVELGECVDACEARVQAVADGYVDEAVFAADRDGGFGAVFGQGIEARPCSAAQYDADNGFHAKPPCFMGENDIT